MLSFFAVTTPGLEPFTHRELLSLGLLQDPVAILPVPQSEIPSSPGRDLSSLPGDGEGQADFEIGGVPFRGDLAALYRANLHLRTASRVLVRLGSHFRATTQPQLHQRLAHLPWERFLSPGQPVRLRVTCHRSKLYNSEVVARTTLSALTERMGTPSLQWKGDQEDSQGALVVVRLTDDRCTVSLDSSGTLLHKRGYRQAVAKAPLRETLAAGVIMASGWDGISPFMDPFCGSGTLPIEACLMALGIPPGKERRFAFMDWPGFDESLWNSLRSAPSTPRQDFGPILASDRDAGAVKMAMANAERAGVVEHIRFACQAVSYLAPPDGTGWVVCNPPYGLRVGQGRDLRNLYAQFGNVLRDRCRGWNLAVVSTEPALLGQMQIKLDTSIVLFNGGLRVRLGRGVVPA